MGTVITAAALVGIVALIIRSMVRDKKNGKSLQCGCDCKHCSGHCGH
ncbi:MAG: FeoB-associated Cys-rich membrane protein [Lachnospiraceae bacterium]|nr:FeoB-associated Cys-rich membrane protein [Lachnospiraceae bacterium]